MKRIIDESGKIISIDSGEEKSFKFPKKSLALALVSISLLAIVFLSFNKLDNREDMPSESVSVSTNNLTVQNYNDENMRQDESYESALATAQQYAEMLNMSKSEVYEVLTSEYASPRFKEAVAEKAVEDLNWDWKKNALEKAILYGTQMNFSKIGIEKQLSSIYGENFTEEEVQYAMDNLPTINWENNALNACYEYEAYFTSTGISLKDYLNEKEFTEEEIEYAINNYKKQPNG